MKTYSTSQIAKLVGVHPNTVRMYEEWGLIEKPKRKENGYRVFTDIHIDQFVLAKKAFQIEVLQAGLRKRIIEVIKLVANHQMNMAQTILAEYIEIAGNEIENAKEAAILSRQLFEKATNDTTTWKRAEAAKELGVTIDTIRNWEMNGLITIKRKENGYRVYDIDDMNRLKVIRSLRCANYSLSAILRLLSKIENNPHEQVDEIELLNVLNTPQEDEDIVSVCDKLIDSLQNAIENATDMLAMIQEMNRKYFLNPTL